ncbi:hypothetical protein B0H14DRAFT_3888681 [Mycena olivaceomarginata]|nr:hypothetical protein B0H14DRAFT_3888681 [Mycena olivaceomarginata]
METKITSHDHGHRSPRSAASSFSASTAPTAQATCETARQLDDTKDYAVQEDDSQEELSDLDMIAEGALGGNDVCGGIAREASTAPQQMLGRLIAPWLRLRDASPPRDQYYYYFCTLRTQFATFTSASMLSPITPPTTFVYTAPSLPYGTDAVPAAAAAAPAVAAAVHYAAPAVAPTVQYAAPAIHYVSAPAVLHAPPRSRRRPRLQSPFPPLLLLHDMTSSGT